jgi:hypothetical protein
LIDHVKRNIISSFNYNLGILLLWKLFAVHQK